jgi:hypothetical protein
MALKEDERREYKRFAASSLAAVNFGDSAAVEARTVNLSDGGVFLSLACDAKASAGAKVTVSFKLPRSTPNTFMLEDVSSQARIVRAQAANDAISRSAGLALQFLKPLDLQIEV